jgi:hypothetical protein
MAASPQLGNSRILRERVSLSSCKCGSATSGRDFGFRRCGFFRTSDLQSCIKNLIVFLAYLKFIFSIKF